MKHLRILSVVVLAAGVAACGGGDGGGGGGGGFQQPAGTVAVNFAVDDTANQVWKAGELEWKGQVDFDSTTRIATKNDAWLNPVHGWAKLYDDGPWDQGNPPGHEPKGSVAGDHKWGVTVFVTPPATGQPPLTFEYGLRDATNPDPANGGWVWIGPNGQFAVPAGATVAINAPGLTFPARGTVDMQLVLDSHALLAVTPPWDTTTVKVKGSAWGWVELTAVDDGTKGDATAGDGKYTFVLSQGINPSAPPYPGLLKTGDKPEFVWTLNGVEYKDPANGAAAVDGVSAAVKAQGAATWTTVPVTLTTGQFVNTTITVP